MNKDFAKKMQRCKEWQTFVGSAVVQLMSFDSVVDFGCSNGYYLAGAKLAGASVTGWDGDIDNPYILDFVKDDIFQADFTKPIELQYKRELCICLEVAEHIPIEYSDVFVKSLTDSSDAIMFSAAPPLQGGDGHCNEQPMEYWIDKFDKNGFFHNMEMTKTIKSIYKTMPFKSRYINIMARNVQWFSNRTPCCHANGGE